MLLRYFKIVALMNSELNQSLATKFVDAAYIRQGSEALKSREKKLTSLLAQRKLPLDGWDDLSIKLLLMEMAQMDSNNFPHNAGAGEREARVASSLVVNRCFNLAHGVGRSGDICAIQPKAAGSSLLVQLANTLVKDMLDISGWLLYTQKSISELLQALRTRRLRSFSLWQLAWPQFNTT